MITHTVHLLRSARPLSTSILRLPVIRRCYERLLQSALDPYRPERHYMRGPGPRWYAKQAALAAVRIDRPPNQA
jgi:hypothetical protein